jgi:hypothetical protein
LHPGDASSILAGSTTFRSPARALSRTSSNGRTAAFQAEYVGSIPAVRSASRISSEDCRPQNGTRGRDSLSALRPTYSMDGSSSSKRLNPGSTPGWGTSLPVLTDSEPGLRSRASRFDSSRGGCRDFALVLADPGLRFLNATFGCDSRRGHRTLCLTVFPLPVLADPGAGLRSRPTRFDSSRGGPDPGRARAASERTRHSTRSRSERRTHHVEATVRFCR